MIVVTRNSARDLPRLLASLPEGGAGVAYEVVVVDNDSSDDTVAIARRATPPVRILTLERNAGYAAGINAGVAAAAGGTAILALNADLYLESGAIRTLLDELQASDVGLCTPRLLGPDGTVAPSLRRDPTVLRAWGEAVLGGNRSGRFPALGEVVHEPASYARATSADWATGAALLVSRRCWEAIGPLDESFFLYSEETDFALRARDAGFRLRYVPRAAVVHTGGQSGTSPVLYALLTRNRLRLFARRHGAARTVGFWLALASGEAARAWRGRTHRAALAALFTPRRARLVARAVNPTAV